MAKIELYVVTSENPDVEKLNQIKVEIIRKFGGLTAIRDSEGYWIDESGKICVDFVEIWQILTSDVDVAYIKAISERLKAICKQKSQLYTINDKPFFI